MAVNRRWSCGTKAVFPRARGCAPHEVFVTLYFRSSAPSHPTPPPAHKGVGALPILLARLPVGHVLISGSLGPAPEQAQLSPLTSLSLSPELSPSWVSNCSHQKRGHPCPQPHLSCPFQGAAHWPLLVCSPSPMAHVQSSGGLAGPASVRAPDAAENPEPTGS